MIKSVYIVFKTAWADKIWKTKINSATLFWFVDLTNVFQLLLCAPHWNNLSATTRVFVRNWRISVAFGQQQKTISFLG